MRFVSVGKTTSNTTRGSHNDVSFNFQIEDGSPTRTGKCEKHCYVNVVHATHYSDRLYSAFNFFAESRPNCST